jgi:hypothetical protein
VDGGGKDITKAGEFSSGMGYYFGMVIVRDVAGDDESIASRYGLPAGAHLGIGVFIDDRGNDAYSDHAPASLSGDWDLTIAWLIDRSGDDAYRAAGITFGTATITSFAALIDDSGEDRYDASGSDYSFAGSSHDEDADRDSQSLGLFLDLGGSKDAYSGFAVSPPLADGSSFVRNRTSKEKPSGAGLFLDR